MTTTRALPADIATILVDEAELARLVDELAAQLGRDFAGRNPVLLGTLCGAAVFLSDLIRRLDFALSVDYVAVSSYGSQSVSTGELVWSKEPSLDLRGRPVVIVEDIVDTGRTLVGLRAALAQRGASQVVACALLDKPSRRVVPVELEYVGKQIPDEFVVGYGLDYNQCYRNLPYVGILRREVYAAIGDE